MDFMPRFDRNLYIAQQPSITRSSDFLDSFSRLSAFEGTPLLASIGFNLRRASRVFYEPFLERVRSWGITPNELGVLLLLDAHDVLSQAALCRLLDIKPTNMARTIARLEEQEFVTKVRDAMDYRASRIRLTEKSRSAIPGWVAAIEEEDIRIRRNLSDEEQELFTRLLKKIWLSDEEVR